MGVIRVVYVGHWSCMFCSRLVFMPSCDSNFCLHLVPFLR